jgi:Zn-dependent alcohol dehydrogenase
MAVKFTVFKGSLSGKIIESQTTISNVSHKEVFLEHTHSGVCSTDSHYLNSDMVLGHEGVGIVKAVGEGVKDLKV